MHNCEHLVGDCKMIVATCITGNSEAIIGDAISSVLPVVQKILIINTSNGSAPIDAAWDAVGMMNVIPLVFEWTGSFADARNYALECARREGADWALTIDTDERLIIDSQFDLYKECEDGPIDSFMVYDEARSYAKDRLIRLQSNAKWRGSVHEALITTGKRKLTDAWRIRELPKTPVQLKVKFERDIQALSDEIVKDPDDARWFFYAGETYKNLGKIDEALDSYVDAYHKSNWDEEKAWSAYRVGECQAIKSDHLDAIGWCSMALREHPGFAEAAWLAGWCSYQLGNDRNAVYWARIARTIADTEKEFPRIGFRHLPAYHDGPADVERHAWMRMKGKK